MTNISSFLFALLVLMACKTPDGLVHSDRRLTTKLDSLLDRHEYFRFRDLLNKDSARLAPQDRLIYEAFVQNAFNRVTRSNAIIARLFSDRAFTVGDSLRARLLFVQRDNFIKLYDYRKAAQTGDTLLARYHATIDSAQIKHVRNLNILYHGIADVPAQQMEIHHDERIPWKRDQVGLTAIPVSTGKDAFDFVFDTRASVSTITRTYAEKLGLRILNSPYEESSGITGNTFTTYPAVADSLKVGNLLIRNVIFQVVPDEVLSFPSIHYQINGIIGFPVIKQWREVHIRHDRVIIIPLTTAQSALRNLAFDESTTVINLKTDVDTLSFHFDSGATFTMLYANYLARFENDVKSKARKESSELGGAGGSRKQESYVYPAFGVYVGDKRVALNDVQVLLQPAYHEQKYYGNVGQDLLMNFQGDRAEF
jgi:hypothetical protein